MFRIKTALVHLVHLVHSMVACFTDTVTNLLVEFEEFELVDEMLDGNPLRPNHAAIRLVDVQDGLQETAETCKQRTGNQCAVAQVSRFSILSFAPSRPKCGTNRCRGSVTMLARPHIDWDHAF